MFPLLGGWAESPDTSQKFAHFPLPHQIFIPSPPKDNST